MDEVKDFAVNAESHLEKIYRDLQAGKWVFDAAEGVRIPRPGKAHRPIVKASLRNRVVQRSILDVLQEQPQIGKYLETETSFGGIRKRAEKRSAVAGALELVQKAIKSGARYYVKTDIKDFFRYVDRERVLTKIAAEISEPQFISLLRDAVKTELSNLEKLKGHEHEFPLHEIGVAQGCCLSPLIGNILLEEFDRAMNGRGIVCIRYIDDFLILGEQKRQVNRAFSSAIRMLKDLGLEVYDPSKDTAKAASGEVKDGFDFLGCDVYSGSMSPDSKARERLLGKVSDLMGESTAAMARPESIEIQKKALTETMKRIDYLLKGWGNSYSFCNNRAVLRELDKKVDKLLADYHSRYLLIRKRLPEKEVAKNRRRILGVHLIEDSKYDPIVLTAPDKSDATKGGRGGRSWKSK